MAMKKPLKDQYRTKDFLCAIKTMAYINDLEKYIAYLEQKEAQSQQHGVVQASGSDVRRGGIATNGRCDEQWPT